MSALHDIRDELVFAVTIMAGVFAVGAWVGERQVIKRYQAEAACPAGEAFRRTVHMDGDRVTVKCDYWRNKP